MKHETLMRANAVLLAKTYLRLDFKQAEQATILAWQDGRWENSFGCITFDPDNGRYAVHEYARS